MKYTYDPFTGTFSRGGKPVAVLKDSSGRPFLRLGSGSQRTKVMAARLAWSIHTGVIPRDDQYVIFLDNDKDNLKWSNLRCVSRSAARHRQKLPRHNTSGHRGVHWMKGVRKWCAKVRLKNKTIHLGVFDDITDAVKAAQEGRKKHHGEFAAEL